MQNLICLTSGLATQLVGNLINWICSNWVGNCLAANGWQAKPAFAGKVTHGPILPPPHTTCWCMCTKIRCSIFHIRCVCVCVGEIGRLQQIKGLPLPLQMYSTIQ